MSWTNGRDTVIVDTFYPEGAAEGPSIYLRMRSKAGNVVERIIAPGHQDYVRPFCWIPAASRERRLRKLRLQFPSAVVHPTERATALDGTELMKVSFDNPTDLWELKNARGIPPTYEADLNYSDQIPLPGRTTRVPPACVALRLGVEHRQGQPVHHSHGRG